MSPSEIVRTFIEDKLNKKDLQGMLDMMSDDIHYQNMPLRAAVGKTEMMDFMRDMGEIDDMTLTIKNIAATGRVVFLERSDSWTMNGVKVVEPFVGVFEVNDDGKICRWSDYFDLRSWESANQHPPAFFAKWARADYKHYYENRLGSP
ncbi:MAG: nuclear transport factor 2 family protein [Steroidobacteraceae bacterium]